MKKRQIAGMLALALALLTAAGCGKQADAGGEPDLPPPAGTEIVSDEKVPKAETPGETGGAAFALTEEELLALPEDPADMYGYDEVDGKIRILYRNGNSDIAVIPAMIDGKEVSQIGAVAFRYDNSLKAVVIPDNVTKIGNEGFVACLELERVYLKGEALVEIGEKAFEACVALSEINLPDSVTTIGVCAFLNCPVLKQIKLSDKLTAVESGVFGMTGLESIKLYDGVAEIGSGAFGNCKQLTLCEIPDSVLNIRNDAFGESPNVIIVASPGSYAAQFAAEKGIKFQEA